LQTLATAVLGKLFGYGPTSISTSRGVWPVFDISVHICGEWGYSKDWKWHILKYQPKF
jgi:hypothetical protein